MKKVAPQCMAAAVAAGSLLAANWAFAQQVDSAAPGDPGRTYQQSDGRDPISTDRKKKSAIQGEISGRRLPASAGRRKDSKKARKILSRRPDRDGVDRWTASTVNGETPRGGGAWLGEPRDRRVGRFFDRLRAQKAKEDEDRQTAESPYADYLAFKKSLSDEAGITYQIQPSLFTQWGWPNGGKAATQVILSPSLNWDMFDNQWIGRGSLQVAYAYNRYQENLQNGATLAARLNVLTPINDTPTNAYSFAQLTYTHELPGNWLQITAGQFQFTNFDSNQYASNQQLTFVNYALSQNGSASYIPTSLGGYVQINPTDTLSFAGGVQDANNVTGNYIQTWTFGEGPWATFGYVQWTPSFPNLGSSQYSLLYYNQPAVTAQPLSAQGWSFNGVQNLDKNWGLFARFNTTSGAISQIKTSVAGGFVYNDPLGRDRSDQIGVGVAWDITNKEAFAGQAVRNSETVVEAYWNYTITKLLLVGPSFQLIIDPALHPNMGTAEVLTFRMTGLF